jgi:hypothetical protein
MKPGLAFHPHETLYADNEEPLMSIPTATEEASAASLTDAQARLALDRIHAAMCVPFQWSPDTPEAVWSLLEMAGYRMPDEGEAQEIEEQIVTGAKHPRAALEPYRPGRPGPGTYLDVVLDGPPGAESGRFSEVEDPTGASVNAGEWIDRGDGTWALRIPLAAEPQEV